MHGTKTYKPPDRIDTENKARIATARKEFTGSLDALFIR